MKSTSCLRDGHKPLDAKSSSATVRVPSFLRVLSCLTNNVTQRSNRVVARVDSDGVSSDEMDDDGRCPIDRVVRGTCCLLGLGDINVLFTRRS